MAERWQPGQPVHLETERFHMRSVKPLWLAVKTRPWTDDPQIMTPLNYRAGGWSVLAWRKTMVHANNRRKFLIGIFSKSAGELIGYETVTVDRNRIAFLMVAIGDKAWWGKGVVVEERQRLLRFLFEDVQASKVWGLPNSRNFPAVFNYNRLGFTVEGVLRQHIRGLAGEDADDVIAYGMLRQEWQARRKTHQT